MTRQSPEDPFRRPTLHSGKPPGPANAAGSMCLAERRGAAWSAPIHE
ncbi:hypothetical protein [Deinococcus sp. QL22]|nr:hypothetical protein [Deinococcus sp. QL22]UQN05899.1 hypothetical protein M1R55_13650 [Deinococcus sp. QL22]